MHGSNSTLGIRSKVRVDTFGATRGKAVPIDKSADKSVDDADWFARIAKRLCSNSEGEKAWMPLHFLTGYGERDCQRYAAGHVRPPAYFLRALLRSEQGWQFLSALMDNSDVEWWADVERARRIAGAVDREA